MLCESRRSRRPRSGSAGTGTGHRDGVGTTTIRGPQKSPYIQIPPDVDVLPKDNSNLLGAQCNWGGMNSYFLYAQEVTNQHKTLKAMSDWGLKVLRIFIDTVPRNHKNTKSQFVDFLEPDHMGPPYKTQVLDLINDLMVRAHDYGVKLAIAMHDRYSLGCYACDGYQKELGLFCAPAHNKKCGPLYLASIFNQNNKTTSAKNTSVVLIGIEFPNKLKENAVISGDRSGSWHQHLITLLRAQISASPHKEKDMRNDASEFYNECDRDLLLWPALGVYLEISESLLHECIWMPP